MTTSPATLVGANVRAEMARRGVSQVALAGRLGISQAAVSKRLRGLTAFDINELHAVADVLGVAVGILMEDHAAEVQSA